MAEKVLKGIVIFLTITAIVYQALPLVLGVMIVIAIFWLKLFDKKIIIKGVEK